MIQTFAKFSYVRLIVLEHQVEYFRLVGDLALGKLDLLRNFGDTRFQLVRDLSSDFVSVETLDVYIFKMVGYLLDLSTGLLREYFELFLDFSFKRLQFDRVFLKLLELSFQCSLLVSDRLLHGFHSGGQLCLDVVVFLLISLYP